MYQYKLKIILLSLWSLAATTPKEASKSTELQKKQPASLDTVTATISKKDAQGRQKLTINAPDHLRYFTCAERFFYRDAGGNWQHLIFDPYVGHGPVIIDDKIHTGPLGWGCDALAETKLNGAVFELRDKYYAWIREQAVGDAGKPKNIPPDTVAPLFRSIKPTKVKFELEYFPAGRREEIKLFTKEIDVDK